MLKKRLSPCLKILAWAITLPTLVTVCCRKHLLKTQKSLSTQLRILKDKNLCDPLRPLRFRNLTAKSAEVRREIENKMDIKTKFEQLITDLQNSICNEIELLDGKAKFKEDVWTRDGGGGGFTRVLENGNIFEKA